MALTPATACIRLRVELADFVRETLALDRNVLLQALQAIHTAIANQNATNLGPLFVALFVIAKRQAGV